MLISIFFNNNRDIFKLNKENCSIFNIMDLETFFDHTVDCNVNFIKEKIRLFLLFYTFFEHQTM